MDQEKPDPSRDPLDEVAEAFLERHRRGEQPAVTEYVQKHPELADEIRELFPALLLMEDLGGGSEPQAGAPAEAELPKQLGEYRILREVGRGGMGVVYEAEQVPLGRHVALKVLPFHNLMDPKVLDRFRREAQAAARLHHSNIVPVFGVGEHEGVHYFAMQFLHGQTLSKVIEELRRLREDEASPATVSLPGMEDPSSHGSAEHEYFRSVARIGVQVGDALSYAHGEGVLHRDIKPSNLLLDGRGTVWVTDFGLAKADEGDALTRSGDIVGTIPYMAPERFKGWSDPRSDVYGLGLTLYELCTLHPAFEDTNVNRLIRQVTQVDPPRPRKLDPHIPRDLETIVLKAIAKDPSHRYQTTAQLADDLRRYLAGEPIRARRSGIFERGVKWAKRRPATAALVGVSVAAVLTLLVGALYYGAKVSQALQAKEREEQETRRALGRAESERDQKDAALQRAHGLRLSAQAHILMKTNPGLAMLLAIEGARRHPSELANQALYEALRICVERKTLVGHEDWVNRAFFSPDGKKVVSYANDSTARIWDTATGRQLSVLRHKGTVTWSEFSPDGRKVLTCSADGTACLWDAQTGKRLLEYKEHKGVVVRGSFSADGRRIVTGSFDGTARVWDARTGRDILALDHQGRVWQARFSRDGRLIITGASTPPSDGAHSQTVHVWDAETGAPIMAVAARGWPNFDVSPDGSRLFLGGNESQPRVWDTRTGKLLLTLREEVGLRAPRFSSDGALLYGATLDGTGHLWDARSGRKLARFEGHTADVSTARFSPDGKRLVTSSLDRTARVWDVATGKTIIVLQGHQGRLQSAAFSSDGRSVVTASYDGTVRLWDTAPHSPVLVLRGHEGRLWEASFNPDGERVVTASDDATARIWDAATGEKLVVLQGHSRGLTSARFSPDGRRVVTGSNDATARIWDAATGDSLATLRGHTGAVWDVAFSPDGKTIATASLDGNARLWDSASGRLHVELKGHTKKLDQVAFSPDGRFVTTVSHDGTARAWEVKSGTCVAVLPLAIEGQARLAFSPDGLTLAAGAGNGTTDLWDVATWKRRKTLVGHESWSQEIRFSPDSRRILTCNEDHTARLWDTATGSLLETFSHPAAIYCGAFSPDGRRLATGGGAGELTQLWEVATGKLLLTLPDHSSWVMSVEFAPDGRRLLTASHDGTARIWELDLLSLALERAPRELTTEERVRYLDLEKATPGEQLKARRFVNRLFGELVLKADVLRQIGSDRSLSDPVRTAALRVAQGREEVDSLLNSAAWALVSRPGGTEDAYERGLRLAESAHRLAPNKLYILNTLGVAQYRTGAHEEALATLRRADAENAKLFLYARSMDLAFITMALHRLGRTEQARAALERLREQMKNPKDAADPNSRAFAAAAERLLGETSEG